MGMNYEGVGTLTWTSDACGSACVACIIYFQKYHCSQSHSIEFSNYTRHDIASVTFECVIVKIFMIFFNKLYIATRTTVGPYFPNSENS